MQNNIKNNERDTFSESVRQKLENHQMPVDVSDWDKIEERLKTKRKRIIPFWFWLSGGAAVAALALLFILRPVSESNEIVSSTTTKIQKVPHQRGSIAVIQRSESIQSIKNNTNPAQFKTQVSTQIKTSIPIDYPPAQVQFHELNDSSKMNRTDSINNLNTENSIAFIPKEKNDTISRNNQYIPNSLVEEQNNEPTLKNKNTGSWLLAASIGSNGSIPTGNSNYESFSGNKNIVNAVTNYTTILTPNEFSKINYNSPLSFGIIIRKDLNKSLGLESGLVYTFLLTTFENNALQRNDARLYLHYIGIPLNLIARLWDNPKWGIYLSGGGMIEKGIQSVYVQNQYTGSQTITTTAITKINGIQWSLNGAVGITYKIQRNLGIFFEPKISYYYDNKQPLSIRTEYPVVIGLTAGVRFQIK